MATEISQPLGTNAFIDPKPKASTSTSFIVDQNNPAFVLNDAGQKVVLVPKYVMPSDNALSRARFFAVLTNLTFTVAGILLAVASLLFISSPFHNQTASGVLFIIGFTLSFLAMFFKTIADCCITVSSAKRASRATAQKSLLRKKSVLMVLLSDFIQLFSSIGMIVGAALFLAGNVNDTGDDFGVSEGDNLSFANGTLKAGLILWIVFSSFWFIGTVFMWLGENIQLYTVRRHSLTKSSPRSDRVRQWISTIAANLMLVAWGGFVLGSAVFLAFHTDAARLGMILWTISSFLLTFYALVKLGSDCAHKTYLSP